MTIFVDGLREEFLEEGSLFFGDDMVNPIDATEFIPAGSSYQFRLSSGRFTCLQTLTTRQRFECHPLNVGGEHV